MANNEALERLVTRLESAVARLEASKVLTSAEAKSILANGKTSYDFLVGYLSSGGRFCDFFPRSLDVEVAFFVHLQPLHASRAPTTKLCTHSTV